MMPITSPGGHLCYSLTGYNMEIPVTPALSSIHLAEWLTELRELGHQFIIKGCNSGAARSEEAQDKVCALNTSLSMNLHVFANPETFYTHFLNVFLGFHGDVIT